MIVNTRIEQNGMNIIEFGLFCMVLRDVMLVNNELQIYETDFSQIYCAIPAYICGTEEKHEPSYDSRSSDKDLNSKPSNKQ
jgi:hypothetical protein